MVTDANAPAPGPVPVVNNVMPGPAQPVANSWETCAQAALRHWPPAEAAIMLAIAAAESGQFTQFHGDPSPQFGPPARACNGMISHGAWQVNMNVHFQRVMDKTGSQDPCVWAKYLEDPFQCADIAFGVYRETAGFRPEPKDAWSTFSGGAYRTHLARAQQVIAQLAH
jgi:hypothetical protein